MSPMINANKLKPITNISKSERCLIFCKTAIVLLLIFYFSLRKYNYLFNNYSTKAEIYMKNIFLLIFITFFKLFCKFSSEEKHENCQSSY